MIGVLTGHYPIGTHAVNLKILEIATCNKLIASCMSEGGGEDSFSFHASLI